MSTKEIVDKILYQFSTHPSKELPFIVALDGLSGAGKTTLAKEIEEELNKNDCKVVTFHIDNHIVERNKRYQTGKEECYEYYYLQWDVNMLATNLFEALSKGCNNIDLPFYVNSADSTSNKQVAIPSDSIVLIEGIFLQRKEWRGYYDFIIYIDLPRDLRYERVLNRNTYIGEYQERLKKYQRRYWPGEDHYLEVEKPIDHADLIIVN
ncbi:kinase [Paenisporosarcina sp. TG20]|uniref:kinase n=1 Tax=Paenisporosarcina sp. TG20 TaxID=1211706 RepID=UPI0002EEE72C|nr:kinase [Paenisporosarcina sp. TG20]